MPGQTCCFKVEHEGSATAIDHVCNTGISDGGKENSLVCCFKQHIGGPPCTLGCATITMAAVSLASPIVLKFSQF